MTAKFLETATAQLDPYYTELIRQHSQDINTSISRLQDDYNKQIERQRPQFQQNLENQDIAEAGAGMAFSSGRNQREQGTITGQQQTLDDLLSTYQRNAEDLGTQQERQIGSRAFAELGVPTLQSYSATRGIPQPKGALNVAGSRNLFNPQGGLFGEIPGQRKTAIDTEVANQEEQLRKSRLLDYSTKWGLGSSSLG